MEIQIKKLLEELLKGTDIDIKDPNLLDTPKRVMLALRYATRGHTQKARKEIIRRFKTKFPTNYKGMVVQTNIKVTGICPHHLKDIDYHINFGIIYKKEALGLSMIQRVIKLLAARLVLQEDLTRDIIQLFQIKLNPEAIAVVVKGYHGCMQYRGIEQRIPTITSMLTGAFLNDSKTREEFFNLIKNQ